MPLEKVDGQKIQREKFVHQQGVVTKAKFIVTSRDRGYTGIFSTGAEDVILRFSETG